jgi:hypothetical protein
MRQPDVLSDKSNLRQSTDISSLWCGGIPLLYNHLPMTNTAAGTDENNSSGALVPSLQATSASTFELVPHDAELIEQLLALGLETLSDAQDDFCLPKTALQDSSSASYVKCSQEEKLRLLTALPREHLLQLIQESEERLRSDRNHQTRPQTTTNTRVPLQDGSNEYASEDVDSQNFDRQVDDVQDQPFDATSYRDFEAGLLASIQNHFLDDTDDQDSLSSVNSTRSGYEGDSPHSKQRLLHQNSLLSKRAYARVLGSIAKPKIKSRHRLSPVEETVVDDPMAPLVITSDEENGFDCSLSTTDSAFALELLQGRSRLRSTGNGGSPKSSHALECCYLTRIAPEHDDKVNQRGSDFIIKPERVPGRIRKEYSIDPADNSLISDTSFDERPIRKRCFRKEDLRDQTLEDDSEESVLLSPERLHQRIDDLASLLATPNSGSTEAAGLDRAETLQTLYLVAPKLHKAVIHRMQSMSENFPPLAAISEGVAAIKQACIEENDPPPSSPQNAEPGLAQSCSTPDKAYWADQSFDCGSEDSVIGGQTKTRSGVEDDSDGATAVIPKTLEAAAVSPRRQPLTFTSPNPTVEELQSSTKPSAVVEINDDANGSFCTLSDILDVPEIEAGFEQSVDKNCSHRADGSTFTVVDERGQPCTDVRQSAKHRDARCLDGPDETHVNQSSEKSQGIVESKNSVMDPLQTEPAPEVWCNAEKDGAETSRVQHGRALIRRIQRRRLSVMLARKVEQQEQRVSTYKSIGDDHVNLSMSASSSSTETIDIKAHMISQLLEEFEIPGENPSIEVGLQDYLSWPVSMTASSFSSSSVESYGQDEGMNYLRERQHTLFRDSMLSRSNAATDQSTTLHDSVDFESDATVVMGSLTVSRKKQSSSPPTHPSAISFTNKKRANNKPYQALPKCADSFEIAPQLQSEDILDALVPPSPESPIREYQLDVQPVYLTNDIECLNHLAACDLSGDDGKVLVFDSDTDHSGSPDNGAKEAFSARKNFHTYRNQEAEVLSSNRKKRSPTSIADFFGDFRPFFPDERISSAGMKGEVAIPFILHEEDDFLHPGVDLTIRYDQSHFEQTHFLRQSSRSPPGRYVN